MGRPPIKAIIEALSLLVVVIVFIAAIAIFVRGPQSQCWKDTLTELDPITSPLTAGLGKCVGKDEFTMGISIKGCVERIDFTDYNGCRRICFEEDIGRVDKEDCLRACGDCEFDQGCVLAVPNIPNLWEYRKVLEAWETYKKRSNIVKTYPTGAFEFANHVTVAVEESATGAVCLDFTRSDTVYDIDSRSKLSVDQCGVLSCI